jgi:hypothetical protein
LEPAVHLDVLDEQILALQGVVSSLDISSLTGKSAADLVERFAKLENLSAAGKGLCAKRVADTGYYGCEGARDAGSWLASVSGESRGAANAAIETANRLELLPQLDEAFRSGELSDKQAHEVARAGWLDPDATDSLLRTARSGSLGGLRNAADQIAAAARSKEEDEERHRRIHEERHLRTWKTRDGAFTGRFSLTPEAGALLMGPLERVADAVFEEAWREGRRESHEAYLADALVLLASGEWPGDEQAGDEPSSGEPSDEEPGGDRPAGDGLPDDWPTPERRGEPPPDQPGRPVANGTRRRRRYKPDYSIIMRVDLEALVRGYLLSGEECSIDGVGHVPVSVVQSYLDRAKLRLVVTEGVDIKSIFSFKRAIPVPLDTALHFRDRTCVVPGCNSSFHLERDHVHEFARNGPTTLSNLALLCPRHHRLKSTKGYRLEGPPGRWRWVKPDGSPAGP